MTKMAMRSPHHRAPRWVIAATVTVAILVVVDRFVAYGAETLIAGQIRAARNLTQSPSVSIAGFPFLTQAITGHYGHVHITLNGLVASQLRIDQIDADLSAVTLPLHDVIDRSVARIPIARTTERIQLRYDDLTRFVRRQSPELRLSYGDNGLLRVTGTLRIAGQAVQAAADAAVAVHDQAVAVTPQRVHALGGVIDDALSRLLRDRLTVLIPLRPLPLGQQLMSVRATAEAVEVVATGQNVVLRTGGG